MSDKHAVIVNAASQFLGGLANGPRWVAEYPEALHFTPRVAMGVLRGLDLECHQAAVVEHYGAENQERTAQTTGFAGAVEAHFGGRR